MEKRELTCICCPMGCSVTATMDGGEIVEIIGHSCQRGKDYAAGEVTHPTRVVTSTVSVEGGRDPVISVKTREAIPKEKIFDCMRAINATTAYAPVEAGDILLENVAGTGVDVIATKAVVKRLYT